MEVNVGTTVLLNFYSFDDIRHLSAATRHMHKACARAQSGTCRLPIYTLGKTDFATITLAQHESHLHGIRQSDLRHRSVNINELSVHYGSTMAVYPRPFEATDILTRPVVGLITAKVRDDAWMYINRHLGDIARLRSRTQELFSQAFQETNIDYGTDPGDGIRAALMLGYGAEDIQIFIFCSCFQYVKLFVTKLRMLSLDDILKRPRDTFRIKHIIKSSQTILGGHFPYADLMKAHTAYQRLKGSPKRLSYNCMVETRPGHMQHAINKIRHVMDGLSGLDRLKYEIRPVVGRNDLLLARTTNFPHGAVSFFAEHLRMVRRLMTCRSVVSLETCVSFPELDAVESVRELRPNKHTHPASVQALTLTAREVKNSPNLDVFERESFLAILGRLQTLYSDAYVGRYLDSLINLICRGIHRYLGLSIDDKTGDHTLDLWISHVELSFASRYSGSPPVAETAAPGYVSRCASSQKLLTLLDYVSHVIIDSLTTILSHRGFETWQVVTNNLQGLGAAWFATAKLRNAFIALPSTSIFHPKIALYQYIHELGHVVHDGLYHGRYYKRPYAQATQRLAYSSFRKHRDPIAQYVGYTALNEAFAELFAIHVLSNGDFAAHERLVNDVCTDLAESAPSTAAAYRITKKQHISDARRLFLNPEKTVPLECVLHHMMQDVAAWDHPVLLDLRSLVNNGFRTDDFWDFWMKLNTTMDSAANN